jgi:hypothetical protein
MEPLSSRQIYRIASRITEQLNQNRLSRYAETQRRLGQLVHRTQSLHSAQRMLEVAISRNWTAAAARLAYGLGRNLGDIAYWVSEARDATRLEEPPTVSVREVAAELLQAQKEFSLLAYSAEEAALSAFTEPIELEGVELGEFEIQLQIDCLGGRPAGQRLPRYCLRSPSRGRRRECPASARLGHAALRGRGDLAHGRRSGVRPNLRFLHDRPLRPKPLQPRFRLRFPPRVERHTVPRLRACRLRRRPQRLPDLPERLLLRLHALM